MSDIDRRIAAPSFIGYGRRAKVYDRRFLNYAEDDFRSCEALIVSCILSCQLVMMWSNFPERTILRLLSKAMNAPWLDKKHKFEECPSWLRLSQLLEFKNLLILEIEEWLIVRVDLDPEVFDLTILSSRVESITGE